MSYLLGLSFDLDASPSLRLKAPPKDLYPNRQPFGWGIAWYPSGDNAAVVIKDPTSVENSSMTQLLRDWKRFRSSVFLSHMRGAAKRRTQQDTHPFSQSYARRTWLIAHTGDLTHDYQARLPMGEDPEFEPIGRTDSEYIFCWLMGHIARAGARTLADVGWPTLHGWLQTINAQGTANLMITDGLDLVVYRDQSAYSELHWTRITPPHTQRRFENEALALDLDDPMDQNLTMCVFSTTPLSDLRWQALAPGQLMVARRGNIQWNSHGEVAATMASVHEADAWVAPHAPPESASALAAVQRSAVANPTHVAPTDPSHRHRVEPAFDPEARYLRVIHDTHYTYKRPVELSTHELRLRPVHDHAQQVLEYSLQITPEGTRSDFEDVFGNQASRVDMEQPYSAMSVCSAALVRLQTPVHLTHSFSSHHDTIPLVWMPWHRDMMHPYLLPAELPVSQLRELSDYAMSFVKRQDHDLIETLLDINQTIHRDYAYVPGSTNLETTPWEVYVNRRGVCQDFANLFICLARLLSIPARYRVGYIYTGAHYANTVQSEASHAWVELYLPLTGWRGFDPTNGCLANQDHIRVACGRNFRDATPTSGTLYRGGGAETMRVDVRVEDVTAEVRARSGRG